MNAELQLPAELQAWLDGVVAGKRFGLANAALLEALWRVADAELAASVGVAGAGAGVGVGMAPESRLTDLRAAIQAGVDSGDAGALDMAAIKRAGRARLAVAVRS